jgi:TrmH family RNA methyltransferase
MISKNQIRFVNSLHQKKFRRSEGLFIAEGEKVVSDLWTDWNGPLLSERCSLPLSRMPSGRISGEMMKISEEDLQKISALTTAQSVLAVVVIPERHLDFSDLASGLSLVLDDIQDPGRHWFESAISLAVTTQKVLTKSRTGFRIYSCSF